MPLHTERPGFAIAVFLLRDVIGQPLGTVGLLGDNLYGYICLHTETESVFGRFQLDYLGAHLCPGKSFLADADEPTLLTPNKAERALMRVPVVVGRGLQQQTHIAFHLFQVDRSKPTLPVIGTEGEGIDLGIGEV